MLFASPRLNSVCFCTLSHCNRCNWGLPSAWFPLLFCTCVCARAQTLVCKKTSIPERSWLHKKPLKFSAAEINSSSLPSCHSVQGNTHAHSSSSESLSHRNILLHFNLQTLYRQACCSPINVLEVTGHFSPVLPLYVFQAEHPVSRWVRAFLSRHIRVGNRQDPSVVVDGKNRYLVQLPRHNGPLDVGGAAGELGLFTSQDG